MHYLLLKQSTIMKKIFILVLIVCVSCNLYSQEIPDKPKEVSKNKCTQNLFGIVKDLKSGEVVPNAFIQLYEGLELVDSIQTNEEAGFSFKVVCNKRFNIKVKAENYAINSKIVFSTTGFEEKIWEVMLFPIREFKYRVPDKLIDVDNITFVADQSSFSSKACKQLDRIVSIMEKYPKVRISINVHTDSQGIQEYDLKMTQDRADGIISYFIDQGIDPSRLGAIGFGSTQLLNNCTPEIKCFESQHKINRRTEFIVL